MAWNIIVILILLGIIVKGLQELLKSGNILVIIVAAVFVLIFFAFGLAIASV